MKPRQSADCSSGGRLRCESRPSHTLPGMPRHLPFAVAILVLPMLAGCTSGSPPAESTPTAAQSETPMPTPTFTSLPMPTLSPDAVEPATPAVPAPAEPADPDSVDPAEYTSTAVDQENGLPLPGVAFTVADGAITCGIFAAGHFATAPGTVSCTPDTFLTLFAQPVPGQPPYVQSGMRERAF